MPRLYLAIVCLFGSLCLATGTPVSSTCVLNSTAQFVYRLPSSVIPSAYDLVLQPQLDSNTFNGTVYITTSVVVPTSCIVIHAFKLSLDFVEFQVGDSTPIFPQGISFDTDKQWAVIEFGTILPLSQGLLTVTFRGSINTAAANGFFQSAADFTPQPPPLLSEPANSNAHAKQSVKATPWNTQGKRKSHPILDLPHPLLDPNSDEPALESNADAPVFMYATQFEPMYARTAYPCFDEPALKAVFSATFIVPLNVTVLFNTPETSVAELSGRLAGHARGLPQDLKFVAFEQTALAVTTYTIAYAMGNFDSVSTTGPNQLPMRIFTPIGKSSWANFALNVSVHAVAYFEGLLNHPYAMQKLDSIAVPAIIQDAEENFGLMTFDPNFLLIDPSNPSVPSRQLITHVVCHEIAHHWFGNLVSLDYWDDMYINEGFARWLQYSCANALFPEWDFYDAGGINNFYSFVYRPAQAQDAPGTAPPLTAPPSVGERPADYDPIISFSYPKGAAINRMTLEAIGPQAWSKALSNFIATYAGGVAGGSELAGAFAVVDSALPAKFFSLISLPDIPVVEVSVLYSANALFIEQSPSSKNWEGSDKAIWWLPFTAIAYSGNPTSPTETLISAEFDSDSLSIQLPPGTFDVSIDPNRTVYWIVDQNNDMLQNRFNEMQNASYPSARRQNLLQNTFLLTTTGQRHVRLAAMGLSALVGVQGAVDQDSWTMTLQYLLTLASMLATQDSLPPFGALVAPSLNQFSNLIGGFQVPANDPYAAIRQQVLFASVFFNDSKSISTALSLFSDPTTLNPSLQPAVYYAVTRFGTEAQYQTLLGYYQSNPTSSFAPTVLTALLASTNHCADILNIVNGFAAPTALAYLNTMITLRWDPSCRSAATSALFKSLPTWISNGSITPSAVLSSPPVLTSQEELNAFVGVLKSSGSFFTPTQSTHLVTQILDNIDVVAYNSLMARSD